VTRRFFSVSGPTFSVVLPTYNRAYVLWRAVQSVVDQTEDDWELIVINDGSTDCTLRLLEEFHDPKIQVISTENSGPSAARNTGISRTSGEFIAYLDSDNRWDQRFLSTFLEHIRKEPENDLWYCGQRCLFWERTADGNWFLECEKEEPRTQYVLPDILSLEGTDTGSMVHRRTIMTQVTGWDEHCKWLEDWDFFLRVYLAFPGRVKWLPKILFEYRQVHGGGADGICGEARENPSVERAGRQYLLKKWREQLTATGLAQLNRPEEDLHPIRAGQHMEGSFE
jgi:glycosyltransferase involved in cell wall biosynthesis